MNAPAMRDRLRKARLIGLKGDALLSAMLWGLALFLIAGVVHLVTILAMPRLSPADAWSRLAARAPLGALHVLERVEPGREVLPLNDPATLVAVCRFDLREGALRLNARVSGEGLLTFSLHARDNGTFYAMTDRAAYRSVIDLVILDEAGLAAREGDEDDAPGELRVLSPMAEGYVYIRSLAPLPGLAAEAEARLRAVQCAIE